MGFDRLDNFQLERPLLGGGAERTVTHMPAGTAGDLRDLGSAQPAGAAAIKFDGSSEGDMVEIHVQPHPDRISRDQVVDLAGLEHSDLSIARTRAQRPHDHGCATPLTANEFGERKHIRDGKGDDGTARRQPRHLFIAGV